MLRLANDWILQNNKIDWFNSLGINGMPACDVIWMLISHLSFLVLVFLWIFCWCLVHLFVFWIFWLLFFNIKFYINICFWHHDSISILSILVSVNSLGSVAASPLQSNNLYFLEQLHYNLTFFCHCLTYWTAMQTF